MGGHSSSLKFRSRSTNDVDRIRPTSEQRNPKRRSRFSALVHTSQKHFSKISFKRKGRSREKVRTFRELISSWPLEDVESLFREMDALNVLNNLCDLADSSRPTVKTIQEQLMNADNKNLVLVFKGEKFPVHLHWMRCRCDRLHQLTTVNTSVLELTSPLAWVENEEFREFIRYLYLGSCHLNSVVLKKMTEWFEVRRSLFEDLFLLESLANKEGDLSITLTSQAKLNSSEEKASLPDFEVRVHSEIIAARSQLWGSLVKRKQGDRIVLDENLLPRALMPLIVHFLYTDHLDLSMISSTAISLSSLSEARAIVSGRSPHSDLHRASQILHVAKFFGLAQLVQLCEDVIISSLTVDNCVSVVTWAEDGGSTYVAAMAMNYIIREFSRISNTHYLFDLSMIQMECIIGSHFVQATEVEILEAIIKWGEHELIKRMENREPNLIADTSHSISRRGIRRTDFNDLELKEIIAPLTAHIRTDYILPPFHQSLNLAYRRGLLERSPLKDLVVCSSTAEINPDLHWFCPDPEALGPRFYAPYYQASKLHMISLCSEVIPSNSDVQDFSRTRRRNDLGPLTVFVESSPENVLEDNVFVSVREAIQTAVQQMDSEFGLRYLSRPFHRKTAVQLIVIRVLRKLEISPEYLTVHIPEWEESREVSSSTSSDRLLSSQPHLDWPDIMTQERTRRVEEVHDDVASETLSECLSIKSEGS